MAGSFTPLAGTVTVITPPLGNDAGLLFELKMLSSKATEFSGKVTLLVTFFIDMEISELFPLKSEMVVESNDTVYSSSELLITKVTDSTLLCLIAELILDIVVIGILTDSASPTGIIKESSPAFSTSDIKLFTS